MRPVLADAAGVPLPPPLPPLLLLLLPCVAQNLVSVEPPVFLYVLNSACDAGRVDVVRVMMAAIDTQLVARVSCGCCNDMHTRALRAHVCLRSCSCCAARRCRAARSACEGRAAPDELRLATALPRAAAACCCCRVSLCLRGRAAACRAGLHTSMSHNRYSASCVQQAGLATQPSSPAHGSG